MELDISWLSLFSWIGNFFQLPQGVVDIPGTWQLLRFVAIVLCKDTEGGFLIPYNNCNFVREQKSCFHKCLFTIIVNKHLNLKAQKRVIRQSLNENCRVKRVERCQQLLQRFPNERSVRKIWFSDEKNHSSHT